MNSDSFCNIIRSVISPSMKTIGFDLFKLSTSGRAYICVFRRNDYYVTISYELGDYYWSTIFQTMKEGQLTDWDNSPSLSDLKGLFIESTSDEERRACERDYSSAIYSDEIELALLKIGRELRLVLPKFICSEGLG